DIVGVACRHERKAHRASDFDRPFHLPPLDFQAVILDFDEITVAEQSLKPSGNFFGLGEMFMAFISACEDGAAEFTGDAAAEADEALVILLEQLTVDSRLEVEALQISLGGELNQIAKAGAVLG